MKDEKKKKLRHQSFWNTPSTRLQGDPNIQHAKWNPHEVKGGGIEYD